MSVTDRSTPDTAASLLQAAAQLGCRLDAAQCERLLTYMALLAHWNRAMNLTALDDPRQMVAWHLLDSLTAVPFLTGTTVLDVGSGAGLPGIPLAIAQPRRSFTLLDSRRKRTQFLTHVRQLLDIPNVDVVTARSEQYRPDRKFDTLVARAFASLPDLLNQAGKLCHQHGRIVALKGKRPDTELSAVKGSGYRVEQVRPIKVPGLDAERHIIVISPQLGTSEPNDNTT